MAKKLVISVLIVLVANFLWASASPVKDTVSTYTAEEKADQKKSKIKEDIKHHLQDSHDFHLFTDETTGKHYGFPLPVILWDEELHVFMSSPSHASAGSKSTFAWDSRIIVSASSVSPKSF